MTGIISKMSGYGAGCLKYYDIGLNLTDPMFRGVYNGKQYHESDLKQVLSRAHQRNVNCALLTGSSLVESKDAISLANETTESPVTLYYTIGVHPCCVNEFANHDATIDRPSNDEDLNKSLHLEVLKDTKFAHSKLQELYDLIQNQLSIDPSKFRAIGEIGLDYDRLYYSSKEMQLLFFEEQLKLSCLVDNPRLPLFLHMRTSCDDFVSIMKKFIDGFYDYEDKFDLKSIVNDDTRKSDSDPVYYKFDPHRKFVTHSFTGSTEDLQNLMNLSPNSFIGMNGCSLKTEENIECAKKVPLERLLLETDAPWCDIRRTHESFKYLLDYQSPYKSVKRDKLAKLPKEDWEKTTIKSRNEPCNMEQVAIVIAGIKQVELSYLVDQVWKTSCEIYG